MLGLQRLRKEAIWLEYLPGTGNRRTDAANIRNFQQRLREHGLGEADRVADVLAVFGVAHAKHEVRVRVRAHSCGEAGVVVADSSGTSSIESNASAFRKKNY